MPDPRLWPDFEIPRDADGGLGESSTDIAVGILSRVTRVRHVGLAAFGPLSRESSPHWLENGGIDQVTKRVKKSNRNAN